MPELPEVETIRRHLAPRVEGRRILDLEIRDPRWCSPVAPGEVSAAVEGRTIERLGRRGKYLLAHLQDDVHLVSHLRMTGTWLYDPPVDPPHARVSLALDDASRLVFVDPRRFGTGEVLLGAEALEDYLGARLGLEPFDPEFTVEHLRAQALGRRMPAKAFLLDQRRIAGVGNIYADEALFRARIHPLRPVGKLTRPQLGALREAVIASLRAGIDAKGASIDDFRHPDGAQGSFQDRFLIHLRQGEPCTVCGTPVRKMVVAGRGTYVCERCQPRPRVRLRARAAR